MQPQQHQLQQHQLPQHLTPQQHRLLMNQQNHQQMSPQIHHQQMLMFQHQQQQGQINMISPQIHQQKMTSQIPIQQQQQQMLFVSNDDRNNVMVQLQNLLRGVMNPPVDDTVLGNNAIALETRIFQASNSRDSYIQLASQQVQNLNFQAARNRQMQQQQPPTLQQVNGALLQLRQQLHQQQMQGIPPSQEHMHMLMRYQQLQQHLQMRQQQQQLPQQGGSPLMFNNSMHQSQQSQPLQDTQTNTTVTNPITTNPTTVSNNSAKTIENNTLIPTPSSTSSAITAADAAKKEDDTKNIPSVKTPPNTLAESNVVNNNNNGEKAAEAVKNEDTKTATVPSSNNSSLVIKMTPITLKDEEKQIVTAKMNELAPLYNSIDSWISILNQSNDVELVKKLVGMKRMVETQFEGLEAPEHIFYLNPYTANQLCENLLKFCNYAQNISYAARQQAYINAQQQLQQQQQQQQQIGSPIPQASISPPMNTSAMNNRFMQGHPQLMGGASFNAANSPGSPLQKADGMGNQQSQHQQQQVSKRNNSVKASPVVSQSALSNVNLMSPPLGTGMPQQPQQLAKNNPNNPNIPSPPKPSPRVTSGNLQSQPPQSPHVMSQVPPMSSPIQYQQQMHLQQQQQMQMSPQQRHQQIQQMFIGRQQALLRHQAMEAQQSMHLPIQQQQHIAQLHHQQKLQLQLQIQNYQAQQQSMMMSPPAPRTSHMRQSSPLNQPALMQPHQPHQQIPYGQTSPVMKPPPLTKTASNPNAASRDTLPAIATTTTTDGGDWNELFSGLDPSPSSPINSLGVLTKEEEDEDGAFNDLFDFDYSPTSSPIQSKGKELLPGKDEGKSAKSPESKKVPLPSESKKEELGEEKKKGAVKKGEIIEKEGERTVAEIKKRSVSPVKKSVNPSTCSPEKAVEKSIKVEALGKRKLEDEDDQDVEKPIVKQAKRATTTEPEKKPTLSSLKEEISALETKYSISFQILDLETHTSIITRLPTAKLTIRLSSRSKYEGEEEDDFFGSLLEQVEFGLIGVDCDDESMKGKMEGLGIGDRDVRITEVLDCLYS